MTSNLGLGLLGLLARQDHTGYELSRRMDRPVGHFWTATHSQIYAELRRLEEDALVRGRDAHGPGPRPKRTYAITDAGREALRSWIVAPPEPVPARDLDTLRVWSLWLLERDEALAVVATLEQGHRRAVDEYRADLDQVERDPASYTPGTPQFATRMTLAGGVRVRQAQIGWCRWMTGQLRENPDRTTTA